MDETEPSNTFIMTLRGYQKQALLSAFRFMLQIRRLTVLLDGCNH